MSVVGVQMGHDWRRGDRKLGVRSYIRRGKDVEVCRTCGS